MPPGRAVDITGGIQSEQWVRGLWEEDGWQRPVDASPNPEQRVVVQIKTSELRDTGYGSARFYKTLRLAHFQGGSYHFKGNGAVLFWFPVPDPPNDLDHPEPGSPLQLALERNKR